MRKVQDVLRLKYASGCDRGGVCMAEVAVDVLRGAHAHRVGRGTGAGPLHRRNGSGRAALVRAVAPS